MRRDELDALVRRQASSHPKRTGRPAAHGPIAPFSKGGSGGIQRGCAGHPRADAAPAIRRDVSGLTIPVRTSRRHARQNEATREMRNGTQMRDEARCHRDDSRLVTCRSRRAPFRRGMLLEVFYGDSNAAPVAHDCCRCVCPEMASEVSLNPPPAPLRAPPAIRAPRRPHHGNPPLPPFRKRGEKAWECGGAGQFAQQYVQSIPTPRVTPLPPFGRRGGGRSPD